jgi:hypothetical protein
MVEKTLVVKFVEQQGPWFQVLIMGKDGVEKKMIMREVDEFRPKREKLPGWLGEEKE